MVITLLSLNCFSQQNEKQTLKDFETFLNKKETKILIENAKSLGFKENGKILEQESKKIVVRDEKVSSTILLTVYSISNSKKQTIEIVELLNPENKESKIWSETSSMNFKVTDGLVVKTKSVKSNAKSGLSCFAQYSKGISQCPNCISCVNSCWSKNKKWKRISCAMSNCAGACVSCVTSVAGFIYCVFN